ncbi:MAG: hypothetical protein H7123_04380 [Thermoleophilia bacterium]|nr:hypothetical protein [Thermoleophilia bacterium]
MRRPLAWVSVWLIVLIAWYVVAPHLVLAVEGRSLRLVIYAAALIFGALVAGTIRAVVPLSGWSRKTGWLLFSVAVVVAVAATAGSLSIISDVAKIAVGIIGGMALGTTFERPGWLAPSALAVSLADLWSVLTPHGVTHVVIKKAPAVVPRLTIDVPIPGFDWGHGLLVGIVDVLFLAVYITAAYRLALSVRAVMIAGACSLAVAIAVSVELLDARAVPVLPVMSALVIVTTARPVFRDALAMWRER